MIPQIGETWFVDFGMAAKPRWAFVVGCQPDGRLALAETLNRIHGRVRRLHVGGYEFLNRMAKQIPPEADSSSEPSTLN